MGSWVGISVKGLSVIFVVLVAVTAGSDVVDGSDEEVVKESGLKVSSRIGLGPQPFHTAIVPSNAHESNRKLSALVARLNFKTEIGALWALGTDQRRLTLRRAVYRLFGDT